MSATATRSRAGSATPVESHARTSHPVLISPAPAHAEEMLG
jgi:hypothetical protein